MKKPVAAVLLILFLLGLVLARMERPIDASSAEPPRKRTAQVPAPTATPVAATKSTIAPARRINAAPSRLPDPTTLAEAKAARIAQLESRVASEPVSVSWASENAGRIGAFLEADNLRAAQLPAVDYADVDCRTTICRVELRTGDSLSAGELTQGILHAISEQMPAAQIFESEGERGTTLLIFSTASATSPATAFRRKR